MRKTSKKISKVSTSEEKTIKRLDSIFREILVMLNDLDLRVTAMEDMHKLSPAAELIPLTADEVTKLDKSELVRTPQEDRPPVRSGRSPYTQEFPRG